MPTIIIHPAVALATMPVLTGIRRKPLVVLSGMLLSVLPDLDVLTFRLGIPYGRMLGHRGFSHSLACACLAATLFTLLNRQLRTSK